MNYDKLIGLGRGMIAYGGSKRGAVMDMKDTKVFYKNSKGSILYEATMPQELGEGVFYAGEAIINAQKVEKRGEQVVFHWVEGRTPRRERLACMDSYREVAEQAMEKHWIEPDIIVPLDFLDKLETGMLSTTLTVEGNLITAVQARSDGSVILESDQRMLNDVGEKRSITFFTNDLLLLKGFITNLHIAIKDDYPLVIEAETNFGAKLRGLVSHQTFDE